MSDREPLFNSRDRSLESRFTLKNTMMGDYSEDDNGVLKQWLQCAKNDFDSIHKGIYAFCVRSINLNKLAQMELRELDRFFECGESLSMAVNIEEHIFRSSEPLFKVELLPEEIFKQYLMLLRGNFDSFLTKGHLDILSLGSVSLEPENLDNPNNKKWWLSARVQALLWIREYLEELIEKGEPEKIFENNQGFQVLNPKKTIPALHKDLIDNKLIAEITLEDFENAFLNSEGSIVWTGLQSQLGYFIQEIKNKGIVFTHQNWKVAGGIFLVKGKCVKGDSLKSGARQITDNPKLIIDNIIKEILSLH